MKPAADILHDAEINLFNATEHALKTVYGINPEKMNYKTMKERFQLMLDKKAVLSETWKSTERELSSLEKQLLDLQTYLDQQLPCQKAAMEEQEQQTQNKDKDRKVSL